MQLPIDILFRTKRSGWDSEYQKMKVSSPDRSSKSLNTLYVVDQV